jgi:hypothetical protein
LNIIYITARPIVHINETRLLINSITDRAADVVATASRPVQALRGGPIFTNRSQLLRAAYGELIARTTVSFKGNICVSVLQAFLRAGSTDNPFSLGIGNRETDAKAYRSANIPPEQILIINTWSNLSVWNEETPSSSWFGLGGISKPAVPPRSEPTALPGRVARSSPNSPNLLGDFVVETPSPSSSMSDGTATLSKPASARHFAVSPSPTDPLARQRSRTPPPSSSRQGMDAFRDSHARKAQTPTDDNIYAVRNRTNPEATLAGDNGEEPMSPTIVVAASLPRNRGACPVTRKFQSYADQNLRAYVEWLGTNNSGNGWIQDNSSRYNGGLVNTIPNSNPGEDRSRDSNELGDRPSLMAASNNAAFAWQRQQVPSSINMREPLSQIDVDAVLSVSDDHFSARTGNDDVDLKVLE